ncbi:MAG TPA: hypothetical protein VMQ93_15000 [Novosphingobium sp.]|nr:hypothetical protein [Novosphingobium sp.]
MISEPFDPADAATWIARGRRPDHAAILADAWQRFPDLPNEADREARVARMRDRALALRPVMEAMSRANDEERQARNFGFTEGKVGRGEGDARDDAILRGRTLHGYDWDRAVRYASGWYALCAAGHNAYYREVVIMRRSAGHKCKTAIFCHAPSH